MWRRVLATLGALGLFGISLSAYNLTLFPLFIGIGVDDCLYVAHAARRGRDLGDARHIVRGITLTTVTTLFAYGSLVYAKNYGFASMGKTAAIGLALTYLCALYVLPLFLRRRA